MTILSIDFHLTISVQSNKIVTALEEDCTAQKMQLGYRLQQIAAAVENKVTDLWPNTQIGFPFQPRRLWREIICHLLESRTLLYPNKKNKKMVGIVEHLRKGNDKEGCLLSSVDLDRQPHRTFLKMYKVHALVHVRRSRWRKGAKSKSTWLETARPTVRNVLQKNIVNLGWKAALTNLLRVTFSCFFKSSSIQRGPTYWPLLLEILYSNVTISAGSVTHRSAK